MRYLFILLFATGLFAQKNKDTKPEMHSLLTDMDVQIDMTDAVNNMYNFKFAQADADFKALRDKYPNHPMPYFLLGLSDYWKMRPNDDDTRFDDRFFAYMDSSVVYAEPMVESKDDKIQAEGAFFMSAANGFKGRIYGDRTQLMKATGAGKNALKYMQMSKNNGDLSPEFMFGDGLYNYYVEYLSKNSSFISAILKLFPPGNMQLGLDQLKFCANNAFFTRTEAQTYLMIIYATEENKPQEAIPYAKYLCATFPDNSYYQRFYLRLLFNTGKFFEAEKLGNTILAKLDSGYYGYEAVTGRYACYILGYIANFKKDLPSAKIYFQRTVSYGEQANALQMGYYLHACTHLGKIYADEGNMEQACFYYSKVKSNAEKGEDDKILTEAKEFLKANNCKKYEEKGKSN
jgi:hypothetical protein